MVQVGAADPRMAKGVGEEIASAPVGVAFGGARGLLRAVA